MAMGRRNKKTRGESERKTHSTCVKHRQQHSEEEEGERKKGRQRERQGDGRQLGNFNVN